MRNSVIPTLISCVILLITPVRTQAEISLSPVITDCHQEAIRGYKEREINVLFPVDFTQGAEFGDEKSIQSFLKKVARDAVELCRTAPNHGGNDIPPIPPTHIKASVGSLFDQFRFEARMALITGRIEVLRNDIYPTYLARKRAEAQAQRQERQASEQADAARRSRTEVRRAFTANNGIEIWANPQTLRTNPFPFKDKVTGIRADFRQMISADEAIFGEILVAGVTSTQFTLAEKPSVLAIKVRGLRPFKTPMGEVNFPFGSFVGVYFCTQRNCEDFFDN